MTTPPHPTASGEGQGPPTPPVVATVPGGRARWSRWLNVAVYAAALWVLVVMAFDWRSLRISAFVIYTVVLLPWLYLGVLPLRKRGTDEEGDTA